MCSVYLSTHIRVAILVYSSPFIYSEGLPYTHLISVLWVLQQAAHRAASHRWPVWQVFQWPRRCPSPSQCTRSPPKPPLPASSLLPCLLITPVSYQMTAGMRQNSHSRLLLISLTYPQRTFRTPVSFPSSTSEFPNSSNSEFPQQLHQ